MRQACQVENRFKALYVKNKLYEVYFKSHNVEPHATQTAASATIGRPGEEANSRVLLGLFRRSLICLLRKRLQPRGPGVSTPTAAFLIRHIYLSRWGNRGDGAAVSEIVYSPLIRWANSHSAQAPLWIPSAPTPRTSLISRGPFQRRWRQNGRGCRRRR